MLFPIVIFSYSISHGRKVFVTMYKSEETEGIHIVWLVKKFSMGLDD